MEKWRKREKGEGWVGDGKAGKRGGGDSPICEILAPPLGVAVAAGQNKNASYRKQIARQHSWSTIISSYLLWSPQRTYITSCCVIAVQNLVVVYHTVCEHVWGQKIGDAAIAPLWWGVADPREICFFPHLCYWTKSVILRQPLRTYGDLSQSLTITPRLSRSLKVIWTDTDRSVTYDFLLVLRYKEQYLPNFPTPLYLMPRWGGSLEIL